MFIVEKKTTEKTLNMRNEPFIFSLLSVSSRVLPFSKIFTIIEHGTIEKKAHRGDHHHYRLSTHLYKTTTMMLLLFKFAGLDGRSAEILLSDINRTFKNFLRAKKNLAMTANNGLFLASGDAL